MPHPMSQRIRPRVSRFAHIMGLIRALKGLIPVFSPAVSRQRPDFSPRSECGTAGDVRRACSGCRTGRRAHGSSQKTSGDIILTLLHFGRCGRLLGGSFGHDVALRVPPFTPRGPRVHRLSPCHDSRRGPGEEAGRSASRPGRPRASRCPAGKRPEHAPSAGPRQPDPRSISRTGARPQASHRRRGGSPGGGNAGFGASVGGALPRGRASAGSGTDLGCAAPVPGRPAPGLSRGRRRWAPSSSALKLAAKALGTCPGGVRGRPPPRLRRPGAGAGPRAPRAAASLPGPDCTTARPRERDTPGPGGDTSAPLRTHLSPLPRKFAWDLPFPSLGCV